MDAMTEVFGEVRRGDVMADHLRDALGVYVEEMKRAAVQRAAMRGGRPAADFVRGMDAGEASVLAGLERLLDDAPRTGGK